MTVSPRRRQEIIDALRRGTVPHSSLDAFAVGLEAFEPALEQELLAVKGGGAVFKAVRGRKLGFATSEVQVSETETPLHRLPPADGPHRAAAGHVPQLPVPGHRG